MDAIRSWAITICLAALAAGMANMLTPKGNLERVFKFTVSLFFLCCVITTLFNLRGIRLSIPSGTSSSHTASSSQSSALQNAVSEQKQEQARESVVSLIKSTCAKQNVTPLSVSVTITANKDGSVSVGTAVITLKSADVSQKGKIADAIKTDLGIDATVKEGENNGEKQ